MGVERTRNWTDTFLKLLALYKKNNVHGVTHGIHRYRTKPRIDKMSKLYVHDAFAWEFGIMLENKYENMVSVFHSKGYKLIDYLSMMQKAVKLCLV